MKKIDNMNDTAIDIDEVSASLQAIIEEVSKAQNELRERVNLPIKEYVENAKRAKEEFEANNPYAEALALAKKEKEELTADIGKYKDIQDKRLKIDKWYSEEYQKLQENKMKMSENNRTQALADLQKLYDQKYLQAESEVWEERGAKISEIVGSGFEDILLKYDDFGDNMKKMANEITSYLAQEAIKGMLKQVFAAEQLQSILGAINTGATSSGFKGAAFSLLKGMTGFFGLTKHHSGGIAPVGANMQLPGTQEQLALLKGGERILSPAENTSYNSNQGASPVVFNNFNVKAWDSKDVSKYLWENRTLLNQITFQGIKDNDAHLRTMVRNA